jgi:cytoskeletal protein CcmA (bactofilin family)
MEPDAGGIAPAKPVYFQHLTPLLQSFMANIGTSISIQGELESSESLRIDGHVRGHVLLRDAELIVGQSARLDADVRAARVLVLGTVNGNVSATERIELGATANVTGGLSANRVVIVEGARFTGRVDMDKRTIAAKIAQYKADQALAATPA